MIDDRFIRWVTATDVDWFFLFVSFFFFVKVAITRDISEKEKPTEHKDEVNSGNKQPFLL